MQLQFMALMKAMQTNPENVMQGQGQNRSMSGEQQTEEQDQAETQKSKHRHKVRITRITDMEMQGLVKSVALDKWSIYFANYYD